MMPRVGHKNRMIRPKRIAVLKNDIPIMRANIIPVQFEPAAPLASSEAVQGGRRFALPVAAGAKQRYGWPPDGTAPVFSNAPGGYS